MTEIDLSALETALDALPKRYPGPGGVAGIVKYGKVVATLAWGYANLDTAAPMTRATRLPICSISKQFTASALLLLQQDDEVTALFKQWDREGYEALSEKVRQITFERRESFHLDLSLERKDIVRTLIKDVLVAPAKRVITIGERLSTLAVRPLTGVPLLLIVLYFGLYKFVGEFGAGTLVDPFGHRWMVQTYQRDDGHAAGASPSAPTMPKRYIFF